MRLGVFITTHINRWGADRHGPVFRHQLLTYYQAMIGHYIRFQSGLDQDQWAVYILDTGSGPEFKSWLDEFLDSDQLPNLKYKEVDNFGGAWAGIKHVMHADPGLMDDHEYLFFHVDDGVEVVKDDWATDLIEHYEGVPDLGIMGRETTTIQLGPQGLPDHHNWCEHISRMWGMKQVESIPHLHGDWWFMDQSTIHELAAIWYDPIESPEAMEWQKTYEDMDFIEVQNLGDGRRTLDNIHVGREIDMPLRLRRLGKQIAGYTGTSIHALQLQHRNFSM